MRPDIVPGGTFPDYELPDHTNVPRRISELQGDDPLVLMLARGHYCPKEHQQHLQLAAAYPQFAVAYTRLLTIATDPHHTLQEFRYTLVLKPGRVIHSVYNGYWFWGRPSVEDLRRDLRALFQEIREDWDLSTAGLREKWEAGDLAPFHGWDRKGSRPTAV